MDKKTTFKARLKNFFKKVGEVIKKFWKQIVSVLAFVLGGILTVLKIKDMKDKKQIAKNEETISDNKKVVEEAKEIQKEIDKVIEDNEKIINKYTKKNNSN